MNIEKIKAVDPGNYELNWAELHELSQEAKGSSIDGILLAFRYGFLRGQRAEKARAKKRREAKA